MSVPPKIQTWLRADAFPQRVLISGGQNRIETALEIASTLQNVAQEKIQKGIHSDTLVFRDTGKSFKIDWSDAAKKDGQGESENVRGMIKWAHQKPSEGRYRIVILENFERVSNVAPHAMLKLLEEPPVKAIFLFTTKNHHQLLDTILSRMTVVQLPLAESNFEVSDEVQQFLGGTNLLQKFKTIEELNKKSKEGEGKKIDRKVFFEFLEQAIAHARNLDAYRKHLELLLETHLGISQNITPRFAMERLVIKITG